MRLTLLLLISIIILSGLRAQQLPANPDPNKCYVRVVTPDEYEVFVEDYLTYSEEEAMFYAHTLIEILVEKERSQWETTTYEGCKSDNPDDCQVLCYRTYPARYDTIYRPAFDTIGSPYYREIETTYVLKKGGLSSYEEIDCKLTSNSVLPIYFMPGTAQFSSGGYPKDILNKRLLALLEDRPSLRIEINAHTSSSGEAGQNQLLSERRALLIRDYLVSQGVNGRRIVTRGYGESQLKNGCADGVDCSEAEHAVNERVEFRILNMDF